MNARSTLFGLLALATLSVACTSEPASAPEEDIVSDESQIRARAECSPGDYGKALQHYKTAVNSSKAHLAGNVCGVEGAMTHSIVEELHTAVTTCHQFKDVIAKSPWAQPVRDVLKDNLALRALTGKLSANLDGLADALPGTVIYGPSGSMGAIRKVRFEANARARLLTLQLSNDGLPLDYVESPYWWLVEGGKVKLIPDGVGPSTLYVLERDDSRAEGFPWFTFVAVPPAEEGDYYSSMPSECDA